MITDPGTASVYTDFQGLARLRAEAGKQSPEAIRETAHQFEALFMQMMLKAMREASPGGGLFDSDQAGFYRDLYDRQIALHLTKGRGMGIADLLTSQLGGQPGLAGPVTPAETLQRVSLARETASTDDGTADPGARADASPLPGVNKPATRVAVTSDTGSTAVGWQPKTPEEFIRDLWPYAERGAQALGVSPEVLVAQAALETGWGQKVIPRPDGSSSYNLFNIKADLRWDGDRATVSTLEYEGGVPGKKRAAFRAYDSIDAAVSDYVDFLRNNPRYGPALEQSADPYAFLQELKSAGYATDPNYVNKIKTIMDQSSFGSQVTELKKAGAVPLS